MVIHGYMWLYMVISGYTWLYVVNYTWLYSASSDLPNLDYLNPLYPNSQKLVNFHEFHYNHYNYYAERVKWWNWAYSHKLL